MSAKQLEEFIGVIETAERLSHNESRMDSIAVFGVPQAEHIWLQAWLVSLPASI